MCFLMFSEKRFIHFAPFEVFAQHLIYTSFSNELQCVMDMGRGENSEKYLLLATLPWITISKCQLRSGNSFMFPSFSISISLAALASDARVLPPSTVSTANNWTNMNKE